MPGHNFGHLVYLIDDAYDEREDTEEKAREEWLRKAREITEEK